MKKTEIIYKNKHFIIINGNQIRCLEYLSISAIVYDPPYVRIKILNSKENILIFYALREMIQCLPSTFFLCNKATIINLTHVNGIDTYGSSLRLYCKSGDTVLVSRRNSKMIRERFLEITDDPVL